MKFILQRFSDNRRSTIGLLFKIGVPFPFRCYSLEDEFRESKVSKETRIPAQLYELVIQKIETPKTLAYRQKYPWFESHIMVKDVPGFIGVYLHIGNTDEDTDGCILLGDSADNNSIGPGNIASSTAAFKRFYTEVYSELKNGAKVFLEIRDEKFLQLK
jgi:hypothetical protein